MTIYEELIQRVSDGESFHINFEKRTMKVGKDYLILHGEYDLDRMHWPLIEMDDILDIIEDLYDKYKYSLPSERSDSKRRKYFKALSIEEIPDEQLMFAETREISQARLEGFILCMILSGKLVWDEFAAGKWFWQSKQDTDLVLLKNWF